MPCFREISKKKKTLGFLNIYIYNYIWHIWHSDVWHPVSIWIATPNLVTPKIRVDPIFSTIEGAWSLVSFRLPWCAETGHKTARKIKAWVFPDHMTHSHSEAGFQRFQLPQIGIKTWFLKDENSWEKKNVLTLTKQSFRCIVAMIDQLRWNGGHNFNCNLSLQAFPQAIQVSHELVKPHQPPVFDVEMIAQFS